ncbi:hypothetical protein D6853_10285 [Butyrivibrio sp. X503]|uniref:hypothetical protein n=1 Tax=Butyrivibrio sp. X503 TaxID=2364878 RepID=UPI000EA9F6DD|nr:hypothetical protein [Butyrivibrio sp. X503]RKM55117.1 hypothetical protein D6853_10285 [Butyrivibrio sp. X503]
MMNKFEYRKKIVLLVLACTFMLLAGCAKLNKAGINSNDHVTVTVNEETQIDITGKAQNIIRDVYDDGGSIYDYMLGHLYRVDDSETIYMDSNPFFEKASYTICLRPEKIPDEDMSKIGYLDFYFQTEEYNCKAVSLFEGWDGTISKLNDYLDDDNSICLEDGKGGRDCRIAAFKDGEIVPIETISEDYDKIAEEIAQKGSLVDYLKAENKTYGRNDSGSCVPTSYTLYRDVNKQPIEFYALYCALLDWGSEYVEGKINNFGLIIWTPKEEYVDIVVACPIDSYEALIKAEMR